MRCKLFVFVPESTEGGEVRQNWWKERGLGDVQVMTHKTTGKKRLLMRRYVELGLMHRASFSDFLLADDDVVAPRWPNGSSAPPAPTCTSVTRRAPRPSASG
jgi:hypothetical protein